jgi:hypothetical protein
MNKCCSDIKKMISNRKEEGIKLLRIKNRLQESNSDIVMKILFGKTISEIQLVKDLNFVDY